MKIRGLILSFGLLVQTGMVAGDDLLPVVDGDPHRNEMGFFDIHICNWPNRPQFMKVLFSTTRFKEIKDMEVFSPDGDKITDIQREPYKLVLVKGKPEKRVFMTDVDVPRGSKNGWYYVVVTTNDDKEYRARDYVVVARLARATGLSPASEDVGVPVPQELKWNPVPGATYYKVFLWDEFAGTRILESELVREPRLKLKPGLIEPGGYYRWMVHARDVNESFILGDFNSGSISDKVGLSIAGQ